MKYAEALAELIDTQHAEAVKYHTPIPGFEEPPTRDEIATSQPNIRISATVMGYLREDALYEVEGVEWGVFNNCREYGLTVSVYGWTFCAYEHRNSDNVIINGCPDADVQPYGPYGTVDDKYNVLAERPWRSEYYAGVQLATLIAAVQDNPAITRAELQAITNTDLISIKLED